MTAEDKPLTLASSAKAPGLETVYELGTVSETTKGILKEPKMTSSGSNLSMPMLSRGRRPSAAVVEADFAALRQHKV